MKKSVEHSELDDPAINKLLLLCEEVTRATKEGTHRFIEPAPGVLLRAKSNQHHIVFGRRGSGKSSLLRKTAADLTIDRRPIAFVDMETFKGHSYPDVLISVLIKSLHEFQKWLTEAATTPATKTSFWKRFFNSSPKRPPFNKKDTGALSARLSKLIEHLERQLREPENSEKHVTEKSGSETANIAQFTGELKAPPASTSSKLEVSLKSIGTIENQTKYTSHKVEYLHQNILDFQRFFQDLSTLSSGPAFLILDDLYHIKKSDQAKVIDYFHRVAKGNSLWLKIGTIKHRTQWYEHSDPPVGVKLGDDAKDIDLDMSLEKFGSLKNFLKSILSNLIAETPPLTINGLLNPTAIDRLIIASGGVTRDFIGIFAKAIL